MRVVKEARAAARAEAEAKGGGRRARAPSRKALESSGRITGLGAVQWMTPEQKVVEKRRKQILREQRQRSMTVGLGPGLVLETYVVPAASVGSASGVADGGREGGKGGEGGTEEAGGEVSNSEPSWQPVPLHILPEAMAMDRQGRKNWRGRPKPVGNGVGGVGSGDGGRGGHSVSGASSPGVDRKLEEGKKSMLGLGSGKNSLSFYSDSNPSGDSSGVKIKIEILDISEEDGEQEKEQGKEKAQEQEQKKNQEQQQEKEKTQDEEKEPKHEAEKVPAGGDNGSTTGAISTLSSAVARPSPATNKEHEGGVSIEGERPSKRAKQTEDDACRSGVEVAPTTTEAEGKAEDQASAMKVEGKGASKKECLAETEGERQGSGALGKAATKEGGEASNVVASACEFGRYDKPSAFGVNGATQSW